MSLSRAAKTSLVAVAIGLLPVTVFSIWNATLKTVPVEEPISLSVGHIQESFPVNFTAEYIIAIEVERKLPHETLQCLLGLGIRDYVHEGQCKNIPSVLHFNWTLAEDGRNLKTGSSDSIIGGGYTDATVENEFGWFEGKRGRHYVLDLNILQDGSVLSVGKPKLRIGVHSSVNEDLAVFGLMTFAWAVSCCLIAALVFAISFIAGRRKNRRTVTTA
jgi:hypothetical protein